MPSRIVFCEREIEARESSASATSVPVVAIDDTEQPGSTGMFLTLVFAADIHEGFRICPLGGDTGQVRQEEEEGEPGEASTGVH